MPEDKGHIQGCQSDSPATSEDLTGDAPVGNDSSREHEENRVSGLILAWRPPIFAIEEDRRDVETSPEWLSWLIACTTHKEDVAMGLPRQKYGSYKEGMQWPFRIYAMT